ncbi:MAG: amidase [Deltaproteobacteria bacterium]|nr:amidase [Deltaproteobacteria bacterium]
MRDRLGAFCTHAELTLPGAHEGPLAGLTFAAKDLFDVAGFVTGAGNPDWLRTHEPATKTAPAVQAVVDAGATLVGKTHMDELAFSINGENAHYGTPVNLRAPGRIPGGSSSGSACVVAGEVVDFALGSDTGGSVRIPASYCGTCGFRPSHGRISLAGVVPLAPSFDTVGWFAGKASVLERVGRVLLADSSERPRPRRLLLADDAFAMADASVRSALQPAVDGLADMIGATVHVTLSGKGLEEWMLAFRILQGREIWTSHGDWIRRVGPSFGPGVKERFEWVATIDAGSIARAEPVREEVSARLDGLLAEGEVLCLPTAPTIAPLKDTPPQELGSVRDRIMALTCIAGLACLPQVSLPVGAIEGCPVGLSLMARRASDVTLLEVARDLEDRHLLETGSRSN